MKKALLTAIAAMGLLAALPSQEAAAGGFGCYVSANGGMAIWDSNTTVTSPLIPTASLGINDLSAHGKTIGFGVGCDARIERLVAGVLFDYDWIMDAANRINIGIGPIGVGTSMELKNQWFIGGRLGYEIAPKVLMYGLLGRTTVNTNDLTISSSLAPLNGGGAVGDFTGWTLGGGLETAIPNTALTLKLEYRYTQLDVKDVGLNVAALQNFANVNMASDMHAVRLGLSYYFGGRSDTETASLK